MYEIQHRLVLKGEDCGPFTIRQLQAMWLAGSITAETLHWMEGYTEWMPLDFIREDLEPPVVVARAVPVAAATMPAVGLAAPKTRLLYVVLAFVLGGLGVHNFYAGRYVPAVCQLGAFLSVPAGLNSLGGMSMAGWFIILAGVIVLGEALFVTKDGRGQKMI
jgi:TM2 domain-containing membrane protein YozV